MFCANGPVGKERCRWSLVPPGNVKVKLSACVVFLYYLQSYTESEIVIAFLEGATLKEFKSIFQ